MTRKPIRSKFMRVIRADVLGMCFGVRDALDTIDRIDDPRGC